MTRVINIKHNPNWRQEGIVYIGRGSMFGNPYKIGKDGTRETIIDSYRAYFQNRIQIGIDHNFRMAVLDLRDEILACYCRPKAGFQGKLLCHGQIIAAYLDGVEPEEVE